MTVFSNDTNILNVINFDQVLHNCNMKVLYHLSSFNNLYDSLHPDIAPLGIALAYATYLGTWNVCMHCMFDTPSPGLSPAAYVRYHRPDYS